MLLDLCAESTMTLKSVDDELPKNQVFAATRGIALDRGIIRPITQKSPVFPYKSG